MPTRRRASIAAVLIALAAVLAWPVVANAAPTPPRPTDRPPIVRGIVVNGSGADVGAEDLNQRFRARIELPRGLSGLILVRTDCGADPEATLDTALVEYGAAQRVGEIYNDTIAWLICQEPPRANFTYAVDNPLARYLDPPSVEQAMTAALEAGGPARAAAAGLNTVIAQLDRAPDGVNARPSPIPVPTPQPLDDESGDRSSAAVLLLALVGAAALAAISVRRRRATRSSDETIPEPDAVRELEASLVQVTQRLIANSPTLDRTIHALEPLGDATRLILLRRHQTMVHRAEALTREAEVVSHMRAARELPERGEEALRRVEDLLVEARALVAYTRQLEREALRAARVQDGALALAEEAEQTIHTARDAYGALRAGPTATASDSRRLPPPEAAFAVPEAWLAAARERAEAGAFLDAGRRADDVIDVATRITRVVRRLRRMEGAVGAAQRLYGALQGHTPDTWRDVIGNGAEAEASLDAAAAALDVALTAPAARLGADPIAGLASGLALATQELARARQLVAAVEARSRHLGRAAAIAREQMADTRASLAACQAAGAGAPAAIRTALGAAADAAEQAAAALDAHAPDGPTALERLATAERALAEANARGLAAPQSADAADRASAIGRLAAAGAVDRAERYLEAHRRDCAPVVVRRVAAASAQLREAERERERRSDPERVADAYLAAARAAATAFAMLAADVRKAEQRRIGWLPRGGGGMTVEALAAVHRSQPFAGRLGSWDALRPSGPIQRPGAWGAMPPGAPGRPTGW
ncbi:MAG: hypothetical protein ABI780_00590 [Ardenticatenales bacterium]